MFNVILPILFGTRRMPLSLAILICVIENLNLSFACFIEMSWKRCSYRFDLRCYFAL